MSPSPRAVSPAGTPEVLSVCCLSLSLISPGDPSFCRKLPYKPVYQPLSPQGRKKVRLLTAPQPQATTHSASRLKWFLPVSVPRIPSTLPQRSPPFDQYKVLKKMAISVYLPKTTFSKLVLQGIFLAPEVVQVLQV